MCITNDFTTTAETLTMGDGSIPATYGTLGQIGGLYLGSSAVLGNLMKQN